MQPDFQLHRLYCSFGPLRPIEYSLTHMPLFSLQRNGRTGVAKDNNLRRLGEAVTLHHLLTNDHC